MRLFYSLGIPAYYAPIATTFLTQSCVSIFLMFKLKQMYQVKYFETIRVGIKTILATGCMVAVLLILKLFVPVFTEGCFEAIFITALYTIIGGKHLFLLLISRKINF